MHLFNHYRADKAHDTEPMEELERVNPGQPRMALRKLLQSGSDPTFRL